MDRPKEFDHILEAHYRKYYDKLVGMKGRGHVGHLAEEIVQEAYTRALEQWEKFDPNTASFSTWFGTKILPQAADYMMWQERRHGMHESIDNVIEEAEQPEEDMSDRWDRYLEVLAAIRANKNRVLLYRTLVVGVPLMDVAAEHGIGLSAAKMTVMRFKQEMNNEDRAL
jgi:RNA polymerase sigma factor (sigma-70 family)